MSEANSYMGAMGAMQWTFLKDESSLTLVSRAIDPMFDGSTVKPGYKHRPISGI